MSTIDDALALFANTGPEYARGMSNHGPMVAEALVSLSQPKAVMPWCENYRKQLLTRPPRCRAIDEDAWYDDIGQGRLFEDWHDLFARTFENESWSISLERWLPRLMPGLSGAALHGLIRTGHAIRNTLAGDNEWRMHELADGLAYWAARFHRLPEASPEPGYDPPARALFLLPRGAIGPISDNISIGEAISRAAALPDFPATINAVSYEMTPVQFIQNMALAFTRALFWHADRPVARIALIHAITAGSVMRDLFRYLLSPESKLDAMRYLWQAGAGLYMAFAERPWADPDELEPPAPDLVSRAVATGDEHVIKATDAILRENARRPNPIFAATLQRIIVAVEREQGISN